MGRERRRQRLAYFHRLFGRTKLVDSRTFAYPSRSLRWRGATRRLFRADEALGIHLAESLPRALDLIEYALRSSPSLGSGLDRLARYGRLLSHCVAARIHREGDSLLFLVHDTATMPLHPARAEFALAVALKQASAAHVVGAAVDVAR